MPTYVYRCPRCQAELEVIRKITDQENAPQCFCREDELSGTLMERVFTPSSFILKGSCWAKDGYK